MADLDLPVVMKTMLIRSCLGLGVLVLLALAVPGRADVEPGRREPFEDRLDLLHVEVELVVTDRKGRLVRDLAPADLELYRDGAKQEILFFGRPASQAPTSGLGEAGGGSRHVVIYVDNPRLRTTRRNLLLRRLRGFVGERIDRGDRVSVVAFDGTVRWLIAQSTDGDRVRDGLEALESWPGGSRRLDLEARQIQQALEDGIETSVIEPVIAGYVARLEADVARSLQALTETVLGMPRLAGATALLYLSDGIPSWPADGWLEAARFGSPSRPDGLRVSIRPKRSPGDDPETQSAPTPAVQYLVSRPRSLPLPGGQRAFAGTGDLLDPFFAAANAHRVSFYPVRPPAQPSLVPGAAGAVSRRRADRLATLSLMAESTGGDLVPHGRFTAALARLSERLDGAYTLGFQISPRQDQPFHTLEVRLARKGLRAHYRRSFTESVIGLGAAPPAPAEPAGVTP